MKIINQDEMLAVLTVGKDPVVLPGPRRPSQPLAFIFLLFILASISLSFRDRS